MDEVGDTGPKRLRELADGLGVSTGVAGQGRIKGLGSELWKAGVAVIAPGKTKGFEEVSVLTIIT